MLARQNDGSNRLFVLGLGVHALAIAILLGNLLSSSSEAETPPAESPAPAAAPELRETASVSEELVPARAPAADEPARVALAVVTPADQEQARAAATTLALVLHDPAAEDDLWADSVAAHARQLARHHEPALEAILADASFTVEEHIAASELLDALRSR
jgi:hypothetical protein